jgi:hypothetical protein
MSLILSGTDGLSDVDGSAATPAIRGTDANTGIFFPAADTIAFAEGGVEAARFDSSGNFGLGTTSPAKKLQINSSDTTDGIRLYCADTGGENLSIVWQSAFGSNRITGDIKSNASGAGGNFILRTANTSAVLTEALRVDNAQNLGIGTTSPNTYGKLVVATTGGTNFISMVDSANGNIYGRLVYDNDYFIYKPNSGTAAFTAGPTGNFTIAGALSKASGSFRIDHPLPQLEETHQLVHSFVESPQADLIYRGKVNLVNGTAIVNIDTASTMTEGTFVMLCREVQCFTTNESGWNHVRGSVTDNILTIECQDQTALDLISWMVIGERKDKHMMDTDWTDDNGKVIVEPLKEQPSTTALESA